MPALQLDPAPRSYTASVTLLRRSDRGATVAPVQTTIADIEAWLLADAMRVDDLLELFEALAWRLVAAGARLDRASLHVGTLHPQVFGFAWNWERADGLCDEVKVAEATLKTDAYRRNPLFRVIEYGEVFRGDTSDPDTVSKYPLMAELARSYRTVDARWLAPVSVK